MPIMILPRDLCIGDGTWTASMQSSSSRALVSRRKFFTYAAAAAGATMLGQSAQPSDPTSELIIDIHQHTTYSGRTNQQLIAHQKAMGVTTTILLPAGSLYGLDAECGRNETVVELSSDYPREYLFFANEVTDLPGAGDEIERYLRRGAIGIGEQKFRVACNSPQLHRLAEIARDYGVPVLMHFMHGRYNTGIENMHKTLEKFPTVNFIGHAQTWWANIDKNHKQEELYPLTKVAPGGITDRLLSDYPNMFGDMSAGSGLNFLIRDEEHAKAFIQRHQDKLMFGSDCNDTLGRGPGCQGAQILANIRRLVGDSAVQRKLLRENARRVLKI
jgi:predicted TIM-barrel fold metal-dependent hydrolase